MKLSRHAKHWFVPHKRNDHRPHLIRRRGLALVLVAIAVVQAAGVLAAPAAVRQGPPRGNVLAYATGSITPPELLAATNQERIKAGLPALRMDSRLNASAQLKAQNMFVENYWAHVSPSGIQPWYWFTTAGYGYRYAGENLAMDFDTTDGTVAGWMNSPGHRANLLGANYGDVGFAVMNGTITGGQTTLVVAHYGQAAAPATIAAASPAPPRPVAKVPAPTATVAQAPPPTVAPTPLPTATAAPVVSPSALPVTLARESAPAAKAYSLFQPLALTRTLSLPSLVTLLLLGLLFVIYGYTHMTVWRKGLRRWQSHHYRRMAAVQVGGLAVVIVFIMTHGLGNVG